MIQLAGSVVASGTGVDTVLSASQVISEVEPIETFETAVGKTASAVRRAADTQTAIRVQISARETLKTYSRLSGRALGTASETRSTGAVNRDVVIHAL